MHIGTSSLDDETLSLNQGTHFFSTGTLFLSNETHFEIQERRPVSPKRPP